MITTYIPTSVTFTFLGVIALSVDHARDVLWYTLLMDIFVSCILYTMMVSRDPSVQLIASFWGVIFGFIGATVVIRSFMTTHPGPVVAILGVKSLFDLYFYTSHLQNIDVHTLVTDIELGY